MPDAAQVLIVDDSRIFRTALAEAMEGVNGITVIGSVFSGVKALEFIQATPPDVITLDVEMPGMNGLQTLDAVMRLNLSRPKDAQIGVIMVSAFTQEGADVTIQALGAGAFDFVTKPRRDSGEASMAELRRELVDKIQLFMAQRSRQAAARPATASPTSVRAQQVQTAAPRNVQAIVVATSTGGPRALEALLPDLARRTDLPILVVQHMPPHFTRSLAESLHRVCQSGGIRITVREAADDEALQPSTIYIAPGGKHLVLRSVLGQIRTGLNQQPPENSCRPSADVLFRSAAAVLGGQVVAVVLTGMGSDGKAGLEAVKRAGGYAIAQDEASSVVWGMPGNAAAAGLVDEVLPLDRIAAAVQAVIRGTQTETK
jgi:two-component system chemotaxis response regulator CheB